MANIKSKEKNIRRIQKATLKNKSTKSRVKTLIKSARQAALDKAPDLKDKLSLAQQALDKAVSSGVLHQNNASRRFSRLQEFVAKQNSVVAK